GRRIGEAIVREGPLLLPCEETRERALRLVEHAVGDGAMAHLALEGDPADETPDEHPEPDREHEADGGEDDPEAPHRSREAIALAAHRLDRHALAHLPPELRHVDVDGARLDALHVTHAPDLGEERPSADDAAALTGEEREDADLAAREGDALLAGREG